MKKITFTVEKSSSGYGAYANFGEHLITTMADTLEELKTSMIEAYNIAAEGNDWPEINVNDINIINDF